mgnify:CR=1 FL=1
MKKIMTSEKIIAKVTALKAIKKIYTNSNIIFLKFPNKYWNVYESEKSIVIIVTEQDIKRITFYTVDFEDLKIVIQSIKGNKVLEVVSKDKYYMSMEIEMLGFKKAISQIRVSSKDISAVFNSNSSVIKYYNSSVGITADDSDLEQINQILWRTFDTRSSHLKSKSELLEQIKEKEFYIYKNSNNKIEMLIQYISSPKCFYFNQVINMGDKCLFHALTLNLLKRYYDQGGKYAYAWVNEGNIASFKYFEKYTLVEDGIYNSVYFMNEFK